MINGLFNCSINIGILHCSLQREIIKHLKQIHKSVTDVVTVRLCSMEDDNLLDEASNLPSPHYNTVKQISTSASTVWHWWGRRTLCVCMHVGECTCVKLHASLFDLGFDITLRILPAHSQPSKCPITDLISLKHAQWSNQDQALPWLSQWRVISSLITLIDPLSGSAWRCKSFFGLVRAEENFQSYEL